MITRSFHARGQIFQVTVDDEDADLVALKWEYSGTTGKGYIVIYGHQFDSGSTFLHQEILRRKIGHELWSGVEPDHKDRNKMNNTRENIRVATRSQNLANMSNRHRSEDLPRGVYRDKKRFSSGLRARGERYYLGNFDTPEEAHKAFKKKHVEVWGEFSPYFEEIIRPTNSHLLQVLQELSTEAHPTLEAFATGDSRDDLARYGLCLVLEAAELVNALPWKRWSRHPSNLPKAAEEFADLLCFVGSIIGLFDRLGVTPEDLTAAYQSKIKENRERFAKYRVELETNPPADAEGEKETKS